MAKYNYHMAKYLKIPNQLKSLLTIFFMVGFSSIYGQNCDAEFFGTNQGNNTIQLHNISSGNYDGAVWDFGGSTSITALNGLAHTFGSAGTHQVCLTITDSNTGCSSTICHDLTIDGIGNYADSSCYYTDCVFPGDANYDNIVNAYDVLSIALNNNTTGTIRPNASTNFVGQPSADWSVNPSLKHVDTDGNGTIELADMVAVQQNFTFEHDNIAQKNAEAVPLWIEFDPIIYPSNPNDPFIISAGIMLGNSNNPVADLLGLAFVLDYDSSLVVPGSVNVVYNTSASIIGQNNTPAEFVLDNTVGSVAMANARSNQTFATGYSRLATAYFTITDIVIGRQSQVKFNLKPHSAKAIDTLGYPLPVYIQEASKTFNTTSTENVIIYNNIGIYPNPADDYLMLDLGTIYGEYVEIFDNLGQKQQEQTLNQRGIIQIPVNSLHTGVYILKIKTEKGSAVKRIFIQ